jgi:hypothetical protein
VPSNRDATIFILYGATNEKGKNFACERKTSADEKENEKRFT